MSDIKGNDENVDIVLVPAEVMEILRIGKSKMYELLHNEDFPSYKIDRRWYINKAKLIEWIDWQSEITKKY